MDMYAQRWHISVISLLSVSRKDGTSISGQPLMILGARGKISIIGNHFGQISVIGYQLH